MMLSAVDPSICEAATLTPPRALGVEGLEARELRLEGALPSFALPE